MAATHADIAEKTLSLAWTGIGKMPKKCQLLFCLGSVHNSPGPHSPFGINQRELLRMVGKATMLKNFLDSVIYEVTMGFTTETMNQIKSYLFLQ